jgi:hypothetical protein
MARLAARHQKFVRGNVGLITFLLIVTNAYATNLLETRLADIAFGHGQVRQVIIDRPEMGSVIEREPALLELLVNGFAGTRIGQRVYWDCREPTGAPSTANPNYRDYSPFVRVSRDPRISGVDKCTMLAFELFNTRHSGEGAALVRMASKRQISRDMFARCCVRLEFTSARLARAFFREHPIRGGSSPENWAYAWVTGVSTDFGDFVRNLETTDDNLVQHYCRYYDELMIVKNQRVKMGFLLEGASK